MERFIAQYGLSRYDAAVLGGAARHGAASTRSSSAEGIDPKLAANWVMGEYSAHLNAAGLEPGHGHVTAARLAALLRLVADGDGVGHGRPSRCSRSWSRSAPSRSTSSRRHDLGQVSDSGELEAVVAAVLAAHPAQVEQFRAGKEQVAGFFVGQVMKATQGKANPQLVSELVRAALSG